MKEKVLFSRVNCIPSRINSLENLPFNVSGYLSNQKHTAFFLIRAECLNKVLQCQMKLIRYWLELC